MTKDGLWDQIAEVKSKAPGRKNVENLDPEAVVRDYESGGAKAISVLTGDLGGGGINSFSGRDVNLLMTDNLLLTRTSMEISVLSLQIGSSPCLLYTSPSPRDQRGSGIAYSS